MLSINRFQLSAHKLPLQVSTLNCSPLIDGGGYVPELSSVPGFGSESWTHKMGNI